MRARLSGVSKSHGAQVVARACLARGRPACSHRPRRAERRRQVDRAPAARGRGGAGHGHRRDRPAARDGRIPAAGARAASRRDAAPAPRSPDRCRGRRAGAGGGGSRPRLRGARTRASSDRYDGALARFLALGGGDLDARAAATCARLGLGVDLDRPFERSLRRRGGSRLARGSPARAGRSAAPRRADEQPRPDGLARLERVRRRVPGRDRRRLARPRVPRPTVQRIAEVDPRSHAIVEWAGRLDGLRAARATRRARAAYRRFADAQQRRRELDARSSRGGGPRRALRVPASGRRRPAPTAGARTLSGRRCGRPRRLLERNPLPEKPFEPWELQLALRAAGRLPSPVVRLAGAVVERGDRSASGRSISSSSPASGVADRGRERQRQDDAAPGAARRARAARGRHARDRPRRRPGVIGQERARYGSASHCSTRSSSAPASLRWTRERCSRSSGSAPPTSAARARRSRPGSARGRISPSSRPAASTSSSSTSRRTTSISRPWSSSRQALAGWDGALVVVSPRPALSRGRGAHARGRARSPIPPSLPRNPPASLHCAAAHGRPEAKDLEVPPRQAPRAARRSTRRASPRARTAARRSRRTASARRARRTAGARSGRSGRPLRSRHREDPRRGRRPGRRPRPGEVVAGAAAAASDAIAPVLFGPADLDTRGLELVPCTEAIAMHEKPAEAVRAKPRLVARPRRPGGRRRGGATPSSRPETPALCSRRRSCTSGGCPECCGPAIAIVIPGAARPDRAHRRRRERRRATRAPRAVRAHGGRLRGGDARRAATRRVRLLSIGEEPEKGNQLTLDGARACSRTLRGSASRATSRAARCSRATPTSSSATASPATSR